jgi:hypothetical protein
VGADVLGLSGLITPSLDEMVFVAKEMQVGLRAWAVCVLVAEEKQVGVCAWAVCASASPRRCRWACARWL